MLLLSEVLTSSERNRRSSSNSIGLVRGVGGTRLTKLIGTSWPKKRTGLVHCIVNASSSLLTVDKILNVFDHCSIFLKPPKSKPRPSWLCTTPALGHNFRRGYWFLFLEPSHDDFRLYLARRCRWTCVLRVYRILALFTYSCYTDRRSLFRGDALFLAAQTLNHQTVTIEFPRVPYHLRCSGCGNSLLYSDL